MYIAEAHAADTWPLGSEVSVVPSHKSLGERVACARRLRQAGVRMPIGVDDMSDGFLHAYAAWPERFYVIHEGVMAYIAQPKHAAYCPAELRLWLSLHIQQSREEAKAKAPAAQRGRSRQRRAAPGMEMEQIMMEAESSIHDLVNEYDQYLAQTTMLSEFEESDFSTNTELTDISDKELASRRDVRERRRKFAKKQGQEYESRTQRRRDRIDGSEEEDDD